MKINIRTILFILCFLFLIIGIFLALGFKDAKQCLGNPFIYGAREIVNEDTESIYCTCSFGSPDYAPFYFNSESIGTLPSQYSDFLE